ncbi:hypothetical protein SDC9_153208 [bioreactor metagenome]|uniref:Uncharacterized protein n=1 Tax=bioreactor metagenome TaxID=1076179 RepID=A0A645EZY8_9ZZZZ
MGLSGCHRNRRGSQLDRRCRRWRGGLRGIPLAGRARRPGDDAGPRPATADAVRALRVRPRRSRSGRGGGGHPLRRPTHGCRPTRRQRYRPGTRPWRTGAVGGGRRQRIDPRRGAGRDRTHAGTRRPRAGQCWAVPRRSGRPAPAVAVPRRRHQWRGTTHPLGQVPGATGRRPDRRAGRGSHTTRRAPRCAGSSGRVHRSTGHHRRADRCPSRRGRSPDPDRAGTRQLDRRRHAAARRRDRDGPAGH